MKLITSALYLLGIKRDASVDWGEYRYESHSCIDRNPIVPKYEITLRRLDGRHADELTTFVCTTQTQHYEKTSGRRTEHNLQTTLHSLFLRLECGLMRPEVVKDLTPGGPYDPPGDQFLKYGNVYR